MSTITARASEVGYAADGPDQVHILGIATLMFEEPATVEDVKPDWKAGNIDFVLSHHGSMFSINVTTDTLVQYTKV